LNVLKGFLEEDYIDYSDWGAEPHEIDGKIVQVNQHFRDRLSA
jgi:hypothetical protein